MSKTKSRDKNTKAAVSIMGDVAEMADNGRAEAGKPGVPEQHEPEPETDSDYHEFDEPDNEEPPKEEDTITFTDEDRYDLPNLEERIRHHGREQALALREIRQRQLWRMIHKDGTLAEKPIAKDEQLYANFEEYCQERLGHPRQWVTHLTNWLSVQEEMDRLGIKERLTVKAAQALCNHNLKDAGGLRAVLEEAKQNNVPLQRDPLKEIVERRARYFRSRRDDYDNMSIKPKAETYAAYKQDVEAVKDLGDGGKFDVVDTALSMEGDFGDNLVTVSKQKNARPRKDQLLAVLTGEPLEEVIAKLTSFDKEQAEIYEKMQQYAAKKKLRQEMQRNGALKQIKDEEKALEDDLVAKGVLTRKKTGIQAEPEPAPPAPDPITEEEEEEEENSLVYNYLGGAFTALENARDCEWPDESWDNLQGELEAIRHKAQECRDIIDNIMAKAQGIILPKFDLDKTDPEPTE